MSSATRDRVCFPYVCYLLYTYRQRLCTSVIFITYGSHINCRTNRPVMLLVLKQYSVSSVCMFPTTLYLSAIGSMYLGTTEHYLLVGK